MMMPDTFPPDAAAVLQCYVYRLVDPRNGETFYVGRGRNDRVFAHVKGVLAYNEFDPDGAHPKLQRIHEIHALGMEVQHIIHRHGMDDSTAKEVEAALIDAYPGLENQMTGEGSNDRGVRHVQEILIEHNTRELVIDRPLILISVGKTYQERGVYDAVRSAWRMSFDRASQYNFVLARHGGLVLGAYHVDRWLRWEPGIFEWDDDPVLKNRIGFEGKPAEPDVWERYVHTRVPQQLMPKGAQTPFRYCDPQGEDIQHSEE